MPRIIEGPPEPGEARPPLGRRLLWFVAIWVGSLVSVGAVAYALKAMLR
ncbi:MAG: DUF2474 family protein [Pseudomonadota bacterium]